MPRQRLLVVDDEAAIREIAQMSLEVVGSYDVRTAESGSDCLSKASAEAPDAILLDVMMPGIDGPTTVARLRDAPQTRDIPVIMLTAKVQASDRERFTTLPGVVGVIAKPFDPMHLPGEVASLLGWDSA